MRKIVNILIGVMLVVTVFSLNVAAIDKNNPTVNPTITDEENDVIGTLAKHPVLFKILQDFGIIPIEDFEFIDITSAQLYEDENEPDFLFASIKIKDLRYTQLRSIYAIRWTYNNKYYAACAHTHSNGKFKWFCGGRIFGLFDNLAYKLGLIKDITGCTIDDEKNLICLKIPKNLIGDPQPGEVLTETHAWSGVRFIWEVLTYPFGGELVKDPTEFGNDYIIQY